MSDGGRFFPLDNRLNVGSDLGMRALADRPTRSRNHHVRPLRVSSAAAARAIAPSRLRTARDEPRDLPAILEPPPATDAWWLTRSSAPTFARRRIALSDECARVLRDSAAGLVVEFNGTTFEGASFIATDDGCELDLGEALSQEMAEVLDEDDGLHVEMIAGRGRPTLAIHPYVDVEG